MLRRYVAFAPRVCRGHNNLTLNTSRNTTIIHRYRLASTFAQNVRSLSSKYPASFLLASGAIAVGVSALVYANYIYQAYIIRAFHKYPEPVAQKLRRALYYTNYDVRPQEALKYYKQALEVATEVGMDPLSDEIIGVKLQVAGLMEHNNQFVKAAQILEIVRRDSLAWMVEHEHDERPKRTRLLAKAVAISIKLGDLYAGPAIYDRELAVERLTWAVETALRERERRVVDQVSDEEEGPWLSDDELGASMEALATQYEKRGYHYLVTPLLVQALGLHKERNCHIAVLMNNIATSVAQQSPVGTRQITNQLSITGVAPTREALLREAESWAKKAIRASREVQPDIRTSECDVACAVATQNLGEFAEMLGNYDTARNRYAQAVNMAEKAGFVDGVDVGRKSLHALATKAHT